MKFQGLLLAHGAFKKYERRLKYYDEFMEKKDLESWRSPDLSTTEIEKLFTFVTHWDYHFTGDKKLFSDDFTAVFEDYSYLQGQNFYEVNLDEKINKSIFNVFDAFAQCNNSGRYESTDASKIAHVTNPDLFIMWDRRIRKGLLENENSQYANNYVNNFLPLIKLELFDLIKECKKGNDLEALEIISMLQEICGGYNITKLLDEYNYMTYTMPVEHQAYIREIKNNTPQEQLNLTFIDSIAFWKDVILKEKYSEKSQNRAISDFLEELRRENIISAKQRREYFVKWRDSPEEREFLSELFDEYKKGKNISKK